jgi:hypothetical protein
MNELRNRFEQERVSVSTLNQKINSVEKSVVEIKDEQKRRTSRVYKSAIP